MDLNEELLRLASGLTPFDLPIGVYVVTKDGRFVACNRRVREILRLPLEGEISDTINPFYAPSHQPEAEREAVRQGLLQAEAEGRYLEKLLAFEVGGREVFVQNFERSLRDADGEVLGYVCCLTDVTEEVRSNRLLQSLPAGVYKLDAEDRCEGTNWAYARILGYDSPEEIAARPSREFYVNPEEDERLRRMVEDQHPEAVVNFIAELRKKNNDTIFANISAHMVTDDDGNYAGREGTLIDVTREERYHRILRDVPVGLTSIRHEGDKDVIVDCNEQFLKLFDFPFTDPSLARGYDARKLHASAAEYERFRSELGAAAKQGRPLSGYPLRVVTLSLEEKTVEISSQPLTDPDGKVFGRTEAARDITREAELRGRLEELTHDIGSLLHNYTTTLLMVQLSSDPVIRSLAPDPFPPGREVTPEQAAEAVAAPGVRLAEALGQLLDQAKEEGRASAFPGETWARLGELLAMLRRYHDEVSEFAALPMVLGEAALEINNFCGPLLRSRRFSREGVRALRDAAQWVLRVTSLISLHQMRDAVLEMDYRVRSLREFVTTNAREPEPLEVCRVAGLLKQVRSNLDEYARSRGVNIRFERVEGEVRVVRREVTRALTNLLHNAIKYSWSRGKSNSSWVDIRASVADGQALIEFENWGVPIKKEEIEQELIFKIGYRGLLSDDRGRIGTGIGLADARRVTRAHGGDVVVRSHPAISSRPEEDYTVAFITTVTMKLPLHRG
jgi:PAS domain S-box-containing protein